MTAIDRPALLEWFRSACVPSGELSGSVRWQKEAVHRDGGRVGFSERGGIEEILRRLVEVHGWQPDPPGGAGPLLALRRGGERISLLLGGQIELETSPCATLAELERQMRRHLGEIQDVTRGWDVVFTETGFSPFARLAEVETVPDQRLRLVERWLDRRSRLSSPLLRGGAAMVVSLPFRSEADCARRLAVAVVLGPIVMALAATSPLANGRPSGFRCFRARCWQGTCAQRLGPLWEMVKEGFTFERWLGWLLGLPVACVPSAGGWVEGPGVSFGRWMDEGIFGRRPGLDDFLLHLDTILPEVRVGRRLELRGADNGPLASCLGLAALWKGLLNDEEAQEEASGVAAAIPLDRVPEVQDLAIESGLSGRFGGRSLRAWAGYLLEIASSGLGRQAPDGPAEVAYLAPLVDLARSGEEEAARTLARWDASPDPRAALAGLAYRSVSDIRPVAPSAGVWGTKELHALPRE